MLKIKTTISCQKKITRRWKEDETQLDYSKDINIEQITREETIEAINKQGKHRDKNKLQQRR